MPERLLRFFLLSTGRILIEIEESPQPGSYHGYRYSPLFGQFAKRSSGEVALPYLHYLDVIEMKIPVDEIGPDRKSPSAAETPETGNPHMLGRGIVAVKPVPSDRHRYTGRIVPLAFRVGTVSNQRIVLCLVLHGFLLSVSLYVTKTKTRITSSATVFFNFFPCTLGLGRSCFPAH